MKQLLFLLLFPCLALAQYPGNAGQKITLGEQTTADGLVYRGEASIDTVTATSKITRANKQDTSAYLLLDTFTNLLWHYKIGSNGWIQAGGSTLDTATMLLPYYRAGRNTIIQAADVPTLNQNTTGSAATLTTGRTIQTNLASTSAATFNGSANITPGVTGILPLANGGTGQTTLAAAGINTGSGTLNYLPKYTATGTTLGNSSIYDNGSLVGIGETSLSDFKLTVKGAFPILFNTTSTVNALTYGGTRFFRNTSTLNNGNGFQYSFNDANGDAAEYGYFGGYIIDNTVGSMDGGFIFAPTLNNSRTEAMRILNDGKVGIGTTAPAVQLHTTSNVRFAGLASITDLRTDADGDLFNGSDFNLKNTIDTINFGLSDVLKLKPVSFNWNDEARNINEYKSMGFIAQDIMDVIPNAASTMGDGDMQVDYNAIVATLTKAIQEQQALIKALEQRILILENK